MGVDLNLYLPLDVDEPWITDAVGVVAGLPTEFKLHKDGLHEFWATDVEGVKLNSTGVPSMGSLDLEFPDKRPFLDGEIHHSASYHFATEQNGSFYNMLMVRSRPFWIAVARKVVRFFGGILRYQDSGTDTLPNLARFKRRCPTRKHGLLPNDGALWRRAQEALSKLKPITVRDLIKANKRAAYQFDGNFMRRLHEAAR